MPPLDARLYGIAPLEYDAHDGVVYLTMVGVMKRLDISESTLRRNPELMRLRRVLGPRTYRWHPDDIDAYQASQEPPPPSREELIEQTLKVGGGKMRAREATLRRLGRAWAALHTQQPGGDRDPS